ncbi:MULTISPECIES: GNAT family N-acetyltransferase [Sporosarcina]|uniref:GNAT family N-acetyltransferase n=1 Tax=Sporosarcina TaxID=1569 RepID=UPI00078D1C0F|nr:GNAT family N-acetyltransferase [Sporosarcina psychrophila]AMQ06565.1 acetyltransferase [Sporosarcina psychrophila]
MSVSLQEVFENEKIILRNLYSFYLHDLSKFTANITIDENGFFDYEDLNSFWTNEGISPYFIKFDGNIIGFILLLERPFLKKENDFGINDIFILNKYKGKGFGIQAVEELFENKKGKYFVIELVNNLPAVSFWRKVYKDFKIDYEEKNQLIDDEPCIIQTFKVSALLKNGN